MIDQLLRNFKPPDLKITDCTMHKVVSPVLAVNKLTCSPGACRHEEMVQEAALETAQQQQSTRQTTAAHGQQAFSRRPQGAVNDTNRSRQSRHQNTAQFQGTREPTGFEKFSRSIKQFFAPKK